MKIDIFNTDKKYRIIFADPPWQPDSKHTGGSMNSGAAQKYETMSLYDLQCMPVRYHVEKDSVLIMWYLSSMPVEAIELAKAWGFSRICNINGLVWEKLTKNGKRHFGMGSHTRATTESALIAYNGSRERLIKDKGIRNLFSAKIPVDSNGNYIHSAKPEEAFEIIDLLYGTNCNRLEMFSRKGRDGWDFFGNEC